MEDNTPADRAKKQWLEIEEAYETGEPADAQIKAENTETAAETRIEGRRYRNVESESLSREKKTPAKRAKQKKYNIALTVLLWLVVSAAFLCGFLFFDKYVQTAYGDYDSFIYTITDGKIDLNPGN